jgi:copper homeostasis protein
LSQPLIEICVEGIDGAIAAHQGGAHRVELCASLLEGGITPSIATIRAAVAAVPIPVMVMLRPRGGDFLYSDREFETMLADAEAIRATGAAGLVFGCLTPDGAIDEPRTRALVQAARPLSVTVHRAFDMTADPHAALEALISCGVDRVLTSGQQPTALQGLPLLSRLVRQAAGRIIILGCGDLDETNIAQVHQAAGLAELHFAAPATADSPMRHRNPALAMGGDDPGREYRRTVTDPALVRAVIAASRRPPPPPGPDRTR